MPIQYIKPLEVEGNKIVKHIKLAETRKERKKSRENRERNKTLLKSPHVSKWLESISRIAI